MSRVNYFVRFGDNYLGRLKVLIKLVAVVVSFGSSPAPMGAGELRGKSGGACSSPGYFCYWQVSLLDDNYFLSGGGSIGFSAGLSLRFFRR